MLAWKNWFSVHNINVVVPQLFLEQGRLPVQMYSRNTGSQASCAEPHSGEKEMESGLVTIHHS